MGKVHCQLERWIVTGCLQPNDGFPSYMYQICQFILGETCQLSILAQVTDKTGLCGNFFFHVSFFQSDKS